MAVVALAVDSPQALLMKVVAMPVFPERPVRPILCTAERGNSLWPSAWGWGLACTPIPQVPTIVLDLLRHVVIDDMLDGREVQALGGYVCGHQNILLAFPEGFNGLGPFLLVWGGSGGSCQSDSRSLGSSGKPGRPGKGLGEGPLKQQSPGLFTCHPDLCPHGWPRPRPP